jgi:hypothetical protein
MNLPLVSFSQDVSLSNPDVIQYFFVFETDDKERIRIPVQKETMDALLKVIYGKQKEAPQEEPSNEESEEEKPVTAFFQEDLKKEVALEEDEEFDDDSFPEDDEVSTNELNEEIPESEEAVPSL